MLSSRKAAVLTCVGVRTVIEGFREEDSTTLTRDAEFQHDPTKDTEVIGDQLRKMPME